MANVRPKVDAVIVGLGWCGSLIAEELTRAGLNVVAIERGPWFETATDLHEFQTTEAIAERLIPTDALSIGGKEAGCATFIDRQLAGDYGKGATLYRLGRFVKGTYEQGTQSALTPADRWRKGLVAIDEYSQAQFG